MTTIDDMARADAGRPGHTPTDDSGETALARLGLRFTDWAERWFPDAYVFVALAVTVVAIAALLNGAPPVTVARTFGDGFWSLIIFTMQMAMIVISGYVVASSPPVAGLVDGLAALLRTGRAAVALTAAVAMLTSLLHWGLSLIFSGLFVRALARRAELRMDYRAAAAAGYLGTGATWALGLTSSAAQLQANPASLPKALLDITGVIPFEQTIFLWQSLVVAAVLLVISVVLALLSAPSDAKAVTAQMMGEIIEWIIEAPYVMQAANDLKVHLGWAVQIYNAAEALPNLINPFWMLPLLGVVGLKPRDIVGFTFLQFVVHVPVVLFLLWFFAGTLIYMPPVIPH